MLDPPSRNLVTHVDNQPKAAPKRTTLTPACLKSESGEGEGGEVKNFNYGPFADGDNAQHTHTDTYCPHFQTVGVVIWHPLHAVSFIRYTVKYRRKTPKVASLIV